MSVRPKQLHEIEKLVIQKRLKQLEFDKPETAKSLGISLKTLYNKLNLYLRQESAERLASLNRISPQESKDVRAQNTR